MKANQRSLGSVRGLEPIHGLRQLEIEKPVRRRSVPCGQRLQSRLVHRPEQAIRTGGVSQNFGNFGSGVIKETGVTGQLVLNVLVRWIISLE